MESVGWAERWGRLCGPAIVSNLAHFGKLGDLTGGCWDLYSVSAGAGKLDAITRYAGTVAE